MQENVQLNIYKLFIIKSVKWFLLIMPIIIIFFQDNGLSMLQIMTLQAGYSLTVAVLEIPSGYLADSWGRKNTIILGCISGFVGMVIYSFGHGFAGFMAAEIVMGLGQSLISGADSALMFDTLLETGKRDKYMKYEGRLTSFGNFSESIAGITGGILATVSLRWPFYAQTIVYFFSIPIAFTLIEPKRVVSESRYSMNHFLKSLRYSLVENSLLKVSILYSSFVGAATLTMAWFVQPFFKLVSLPLGLYGVLWTILNLSAGMMSLVAYKIERAIGARISLLLVSFFIPVLYMFLGFFPYPWAIGFILVFYLFRGLATPVLKDCVNHYSPSEIRATVLSIRNFIIRVGFSLIAPVLGFLTDAYSLPVAFFIGGAVFFVLCMSGFFFYIKTRQKGFA